jgi:hypothetical protein
VERSETSEKKPKFLSRVEDHPGFPNLEGLRPVLVRKAQISVESYLVYQSVSQKSILCDVYFITLNFMIDNLETQKKSISMKNSQFFDYLLYAKSK